MGILNRRSFLKSIGLGAASLSMPSLPAMDEDGESRPNILLIMADDLGAECLTSYRGLSNKTPNIDALARGGIQFQNCYATPLCTPSRIQLMTGQYPFRSGWNRGIWEIEPGEQCLKPEQPNIASILKRAGYATAVAGKWQLARFDEYPDHPKACGFDEHCLWRWVDGQEMFPRYWSPGIWQNGKVLEDTENRFGPDIYCSFLKDFIKRNRSKPFFATYSMTLPHQPFVLPPGMGDDREGTRAAGKQARTNFKAMVEYMDKLVGDLVSTLDELGIRKNTIVLFTGDNGTPTQIKSKMKNRTITGGKFTLTEAGTRVPLIASWPGTAGKSVVSTDLIDFSDILPTLAEAAGASLPENVVFDGTSFLPQLKGEKGNPREWIYCQLREDWFIRDHKFKLMHDGTLYNMEFRYFPREQKTRIGPDAVSAKKRLLETATRLRKVRE